MCSGASLSSPVGGVIAGLDPIPTEITTGYHVVVNRASLATPPLCIYSANM